MDENHDGQVSEEEFIEVLYSFSVKIVTFQVMLSNNQKFAYENTKIWSIFRPV